MSAKRELSMRQLRHLLRLHHDGVSAREIGRRLGVARSTIQDNLKRAAAGLRWPLADGVTDEALERQLFGRAGVAQGQRCRSAWGPNADRRGNSLTCLRKEGSNSGADSQTSSKTQLPPACRQNAGLGSAL